MTCCTSPDVNLAEEVKFRPIECDRRLCGDFSLRRTNLPANVRTSCCGGFARARCPGSAGFCYSRHPLRERPCDKAFEVQSEYARAGYERYVAHASKLGELYTDLAKEAFRPYQSLSRN